MRLPLSAICVASSLASLLTAAEPAKKPDLTPNQVDAQTIFAHQAGTVALPTADAPAVVGAYLWGGRADINYRSFFQWELRVAAGERTLDALRMRITTLGPSRQTLAVGPWQNLPQIAAHGAIDVSYRQNCTIFPAYQVELAWNGGQETYLASDKGAVPCALSPLQVQGYVMAVNLAFEPDTAHPGFVDVSWSDWNVGGKLAHGIVHSLHLYNAAGKDFKDLPYPPSPEASAAKAAKHPAPAAGKPSGSDVTVLAVGAVAERHWHLNAPAFVTLSMSVEQADEPGSLEAQGFTSAKDVEVSYVHAEGGLLKAKVRNGMASAQEGVVVTITLQDAKGADLKAIEIPVGHLDAGAISAVSAPLPAGLVFSGYASTWRAAEAIAGAAPAVSTAPTASIAQPREDGGHDLLALGIELAVGHQVGLTFTATSIDHTVNGTLIRGVLHNHTGHELTALHLRIAAEDGEERSVLRWQAARYRDHAEDAIAIACPLAHLSTLALETESAH